MTPDRTQPLTIVTIAHYEKSYDAEAKARESYTFRGKWSDRSALLFWLRDCGINFWEKIK